MFVTEDSAFSFIPSSEILKTAFLGFKIKPAFERYTRAQLLRDL